MEKNSLVKAESETALVDVLQLRKGPTGQQQVNSTDNICTSLTSPSRSPPPFAPMTCLPQALAVLDAGARESLADILSKSLAKLAGQPEGKVTPNGSC